VRGERRLLHVGEYLIGRASRLLPGEIREERRREWTAELPAILRDPDTRSAARRTARMLRYAAGTIRGSALAPSNARGRLTVVMAVVMAVVTVCMVTVVVANVMNAVKTPGDWVSYFWISVAGVNLSLLGTRLILGIRRADRPMEGVRNAVLEYGARMTPGWLLSRLLRAVGADRSDLPAPVTAACAPATTRATADTAEQAISLARDAVDRFYRVRLRPGYRTADVDEFVARIEATLVAGGQSGPVVTAADVEAVKFGTTRRGGYDEMVVDEALDLYADGLAKRALSRPNNGSRPRQV
jgi:DivIVA domain-containing protein